MREDEMAGWHHQLNRQEFEQPLGDGEGDPGLIPLSGRSVEKGIATHSSILAWEIPWTDEPRRLHLNAFIPNILTT